MSPLLKKVEKAGIKGIKKKRKPYQITPDDFFHETETVRLLYSQLINNDQPNRVVVIPSVSYGIANVVNNLSFSDGEVLVADEQFPSNVYPWLRLEERGCSVRFVGAPDSGSRTSSWNEAILDAINEETRAVSIGHVHWSDGTVFDLAAIRQKLDQFGGLLIIDGTQSVGALPFSVKEIRPDALICAGYKWLMGPYSIGLAYYGPAFDHGTPIEENWINRLHSEEFSGLVNYEASYQEGALRYEVGEHSNFIGIPMLHQGLKQLLRWIPEEIQDYCKALTNEALHELSEMGYLLESESNRAHHLFGIRCPEFVDLEALKSSFRQHKVSVSVRGSAIRVSPHVYNDEIDMRKLVSAMKAPIFAEKN